MTYKIYLLLGIGAIMGSILGWLIGDETDAKKIAAKGEINQQAAKK